MPKRILLIDDDETLCKELADILHDEGYSADTASESGKAMQYIENDRHDLYLIDYKMEGITGIEIVKKIKDLDPGRKVLIISGRPGIEKIVHDEGVSHMLSGILSKPFDVSILLNKISDIVNK
ncbi:MAG TPA: response regulator [Candidatus Omnitrophota bacterium]|nr:response regulator [Candidatus Omnitrophota bacterium]